MERTLAIIKPDAVGKHKEITGHIRKAGFNIVARSKRTLDRIDATEFYNEHQGKPFFNDLIDYLTSGPAVFLVLSKPRAISQWRTLIGPTNTDTAKQEQPGCLRALYGTTPHRNGLHGSDSFVSAEREIKLIFPNIESKPMQDQIRNYLAVEVNHILSTGLAELCKTKPDDPVLWFADWLQNHRDDTDGLMSAQRPPAAVQHKQMMNGDG